MQLQQSERMTKQVAYIMIELNENCIWLKKNKFEVRKKIFWNCLPTGFVLVYLLFAINNSPDFLKKELSLTFWILFIIGIVIIIVHLIFGIKRLKRVVTNYKLCKKDVLSINNRPLQIEEEILIIVQDVIPIGGLGGSFTVGVSQGDHFFGICYDLKKKDANIIANFISETFHYRLEHRESILFPLYKLH